MNPCGRVTELPGDRHWFRVYASISECNLTLFLVSRRLMKSFKCLNRLRGGCRCRSCFRRGSGCPLTSLRHEVGARLHPILGRKTFIRLVAHLHHHQDVPSNLIATALKEHGPAFKLSRETSGILCLKGPYCLPRVHPRIRAMHISNAR